MHGPGGGGPYGGGPHGGGHHGGPFPEPMPRRMWGWRQPGCFGPGCFGPGCFGCLASLILIITTPLLIIFSVLKFFF